MTVARDVDTWVVGDRVSWRGYLGTVRRVSAEGIHFLVVFDAPGPPVWLLACGGRYFYAQELEAVGPVE